MEKVAPKKTSKVDKRAKIISSFKMYILENGKAPVSVFKFCRDIKIKEAEFYAYFPNFNAIKGAVWQEIFSNTLSILRAEPVYNEYSSREKLLAFFYTWIEELKHNRSYLLAIYDTEGLPPKSLPEELRGFREDFKAYAKEVIKEGEESEEIAQRPYITDKYDEAVWLQVMFLFRFWIKDQSAGFEKTDQAIEKSVNFAFDLMGKSALDSFVDFAKFLYQSR
ncbi:hypothetical protein GCM10007049_18170 [Echinicola pacifica]|uniref:Tetracyclin repressor-like C-terminal domain-containing protein n=1 Tax=Echinicola pacifica TaxID=346377 RepID=A0A918PZN6_9BACT|nr:TetR family transcriptional regulator C-terminal domain-containing protein [Echinicola pacifica]GGZ25962.1 hypothetical protein GCM10007049_18170 [Echinicola pacifica]